MALSIAVGGTIFALMFFAAWVIDLRFRSLQQDAELRRLQGTVDRVAQDVVTLWSADRQRLLSEPAHAAPGALARTASFTLDHEPHPGDSAPSSGPRRKMPPDAASLLVRSLAGADRGPQDESLGAAVISGAQEELSLVAEMLLAIDTKWREAWPEPPAIGNILTALSDRIRAGLALLSRKGGSGPPPPPAADDEEPPSSSDPDGGSLPH